eukprot:CAMPEP_0172552752 /NCGR_PEP_ID=MMETSP1067-20121228/47172_1 /TAXON_ID=265564 ORGANISM="Thalassiosira punctigera, Strain Tpunct2005C2" /NCGR_SAMPLE_ID=MMETSP1067 /ASSEMBLY_ACC=CAM_ASM_000444 /LENGTH=646 /DNA_ID=CAMNT_0013340803 /DNA_START=52 /DNA_END=1989 /DNA_ORIENTATION=+
MTETQSNDEGNCLPLPPHHDDTRGGFQRVENYDACEEGEDEREDDIALSLNELMYSAHSFHVISLPVSVTMILAALAVTYINTPETIQQGEALMSQAYHVWKVGENDSTSKQLALDFMNGLVIVTVIGTMTFGIVLLYKYRCMKVLIGYMMFSSMTLLGVLGAELFNVAIEKYRIPIDWFTFVFGLYNFAVVGVTAIFYATGIPTYITQGYLICSSVIISWQLSHFDTISTWTLLIMLGLYDLCAVLTPCGPLRALVNLMSDEDSPEMPGLLYEAEIPEGLKRPVMSGRNTNDSEESDEASESGNLPPSSMSAERYQQPSVQNPESDNNIPPGRTSSDASGYSTSSGDVEMSSAMAHNDRDKSSSNGPDDQMKTKAPKIDRERSDDSKMSTLNSVSSERPPAPTGMIPFAIAKLYRLPLTSPPPFATPSVGRENTGLGRRKRSGQSGHISTSPLLKSDSAAEDSSSSTNPSDDGTPPDPYVIPDGEYTPAQTRTLVEAILPRNGAKIVKQPRRALQGDKEDRYGIIGSDGTLKRILFVDRNNGKVYEEMDDDDGSEYEGRFSNTIKLGLGDFIFYSVLVAKSAQYSFTCFISSFLVILAGLGGTLVLLAVYKHALPALPISIFLAVFFYVMVRFVAEPWIHVVIST